MKFYLLRGGPFGADAVHGGGSAACVGKAMNDSCYRREEQIQELLMRGYENRDISTELGMSVRTVKAYMHRMFERNGIRNGVKRVKLAVKLYRETLYGSANWGRST